LNGLDLFTGIAGNSLGLREYVDTLAYCEQDRHAQSVLLSRMSEGELTPAPIWDDIQTLNGSHFDKQIDIIVGGFPCQDISIAGNGEGLAGERSGLFFEVCRLVKEISPTFVFLENVPAIRTRGLRTVVRELTDLGYDCRWTSVSAAEVGAPHLRKRWFLLAYSNNSGGKLQHGWSGRSEHGEVSTESRVYGETQSLADTKGERDRGALRAVARKTEEEQRPEDQYESESFKLGGGSGRREERSLADTDKSRLEGRTETGNSSEQRSNSDEQSSGCSEIKGCHWSVEPDVGRVAYGTSFRVDRIKRLGNGVVPAQAKEAFERLMGII